MNRLSLPFLLTFSSLALSQSNQSTLTGFVTDPSGASLPRVSITIRESRTGLVWNTAASASGSFTQPLLPPGLYSVSFSAEGFAPVERNAVELPAQSSVRLDTQLSLATAKQSLQLSAEPPLLQTDRSDLSRSLTTRQLLELPLATRNFQELASILPGVTPSSDVSTPLQNPMDTRWRTPGAIRSPARLLTVQGN